MVSEAKENPTKSKTLGKQVSEIVISVDSGISKMAESISNMVTSLQPAIDAIGQMAVKTLNVAYKLSELFKKMKLTKSMKDKVILLLKKRYVYGKKTLPDMQNIIFPVTNKDERKKEFDKLIEYLS